MTFITAAITSAIGIGAGAAGTFMASIGSCLIATNFEEFNMGEYRDSH